MCKIGPESLMCSCPREGVEGDPEGAALDPGELVICAVIMSSTIVIHYQECTAIKGTLMP